MADTLRHLKRAAKHRGDRDIKSVTKREVIEFLEQIATEHLTTANHVHASLSTMYRWAEEREIVDKSPLTGVARVAAEMERDRVLDVYEIRVVWEATKALPYPASQLVRMLLITGQRLGETAGMRRREIVDGSWIIPAERNKARRVQVVPLSTLACEVIAECQQPSEYVFAGRSGQRPFSSAGAAKSRLDARIAELRQEQGLPPMDHWAFHDLRRTAATEMSRLGTERFTIKRVLNHADREVTGRYDRHTHDGIKLTALDLWAKRLREIVDPTPDNVIGPPTFRAVG